MEEFSRYLIDAVNAIRKRLGNTAHSEVRGSVLAALKHQEQVGSLEGHREWITLLLADYYDPMYEFQLNKKKERVVFSGSYAEVLEWARNN